MRIVTGKELTDAAPGLLVQLTGQASRVVVDVGTGDARTAYRAAREHPDWLVIGLDPAWRRMSEIAIRARRKPAKGGARNLLLVAGTAEQPPPELHGIADEIWVLMPWGKLLHGLVRGDADVCTGLRSIAAPGASLTATVGRSIWRDPVPREIQGLPELTSSYVQNVLASRLAHAGWQVTGAGVAGESVEDGATAGTARPEQHTETELHGRSSWTRRLGATTGEPVFRLTARARPLRSTD